MSEQVKIIDGKPVCFLYDEPLPSKVVVCSRCDGKGVSTAYLGAFTQEEMENALELIEDLREPHLTEQDKDEQAKIEQKKEQDFELGADYGRVNGWYSDTFGDSFSDPYDY